ncbi:DUF4080 domain-containing protein [Caldicellulosiruptoraceae bacterium PP1]
MILFVAINSSYVHTNLAVRYLYHICNENYNCRFVEYNINQDVKSVLYNILSYKPDIVAISTYIWNRNYVLKLAEGIKKVDKNIYIVLGGPEVYFDDISKLQYIDEIIRGEGEYRILEFLDNYQENNNMYNKKDYPLFDLSHLPFAYKDEILDINKIYYYESSRGCPFRCSYCLSSLDKSVRFAPIEKVFEELKFLFEKEVKLIKFVDRTFNIDIERSIKIIEFCKTHSKTTQVHFEISPDLLNDDIIKSLNNSKKGLFRLEIGLQSFNEQTLKEINRTYSLEKVDNNLKKLLQDTTCITHLDLIAGLPHEDYQSFKESFNKTYFYFPDEIQLGFLKVLKGTKIDSQVEKFNIKYWDTPPYEVISTKSISFNELYRLKQIEEFVDRLYNRRLLLYTIKAISKREKPSDFFEKITIAVDINKNNKVFISQLYNFIKSNNYFDNQIELKNIFRYDILRNLPEEYLPDELVFNETEKNEIKNRVYQIKDIENFEVNNIKQIQRKYRVGVFDFNIENYVKDDIIKFEKAFYVFLNDKIIKI